MKYKCVINKYYIKLNRSIVICLKFHNHIFARAYENDSNTSKHLKQPDGPTPSQCQLFST